MESLSLPGVNFRFQGPYSEPPLVILAGGRRPSLRWMRQFLPGKEIWCADSGLVACLRSGFFPSRLIGDGDSTPPELWAWAVERGATVSRHPREKDLTDLQLAFFAAAEERPGRPVVVAGCWGGRFDHLWANVFSVLWAEDRGTRVLAFADHREAMFFLRGGEGVELEIRARCETVLSLLSLSEACSGVAVRNVRWEMDNATLRQDRPYTVSNRQEGRDSRPSISLRSGHLAVYCGWI